MNASSLSVIPRAAGISLAGVGACVAADHLQNSQSRDEPRTPNKDQRIRQANFLESGQSLAQLSYQNPAQNFSHNVSQKLSYPTDTPLRVAVPRVRLPDVSTDPWQRTSATQKHVQTFKAQAFKTQAFKTQTFKTKVRTAFVTHMQLAFREGLPKPLALAQAQQLLMSAYADDANKMGGAPAQLRSELDTLSSQFPDFTVQPTGGKMRKAPEVSALGEEASLRHTLIRDQSGRCHEVLTTIYPDEARALADQGRSVGLGKIALGRGAFGVVRLAKNERGEFEAVKKLKHVMPDHEPDHEIAMLKKITRGDHLVRYHGSAKIALKKDLAETFIFMGLAGQVDGIEAAALREERAQDPDFDSAAYTHDIGEQYIRAVAELHDQGVYHCDLKLDNFTHQFQEDGSELVKLIDYGGATDEENIPTMTGTPGFIAPEFSRFFYHKKTSARLQRGPEENVRPQSSLPPNAPKINATGHALSNAKRDAWALGMVLLAWRLGEEPAQGENRQLTVVDQRSAEATTVALTFHRGECLGTRDSQRWAGNTWDEVIGKLLDVDPRHRITPEEALRCPLFMT